jgi:Ca2+/H+ antiporter, TMEM165/GDT1 family
LLAAAFAAFVTVFIAEFGDKSQLVCLSMACRYPPLHVLAGAMTAMAVVLSLGVAAGGLIYAFIPHALVATIAGLFFIAMGLLNYLHKSKPPDATCTRDGFLHTMVLIFVAEFGDKTQLATLLLVASLGYPAAVFSGALLAMFLNHLLAVYLGSRIISRVSPLILRIGTSALFILVGLYLVIAR